MVGPVLIKGFPGQATYHPRQVSYKIRRLDKDHWYKLVKRYKNFKGIMVRPSDILRYEILHKISGFYNEIYGLHYLKGILVEN